MTHYNSKYRKFIDDKHKIAPDSMVRGKFYLIKEYKYVDGHTGKFQDALAPIIFTLFVSKTKDEIHAVKVSDVNPSLIKKFFGKLLNEDTEKIQIKGSSKVVYSKLVSKIPVVTSDAYRTYKWSGITKVIELKMDQAEIIPKALLKKENKKDKK